MPADILLYGLVAAGLVFWLRNVLGTRHGDENQRPNPFTDLPDAKAKQRDLSGAAAGFGANVADAPESRIDKNVTLAGVNIESGLEDITRLDRTFELAAFTKGAQDAFVMIVEAFANRDKELLKNLLSEPLYKSFTKVIDDRDEKGETASVEIHAVRKVDILEAGTNGKNAVITVRFVADETSVLRDKDGELIFGNPDRVTETRDIWTFSRDTRSRDPKWALVATREDEDDEQADSTVPESNAGK